VKLVLGVKLVAFTFGVHSYKTNFITEQKILALKSVESGKSAEDLQIFSLILIYFKKDTANEFKKQIWFKGRRGGNQRKIVPFSKPTVGFVYKDS
jgi:hypothetical protein